MIKILRMRAVTQSSPAGAITSQIHAIKRATMRGGDGCTQTSDLQVPYDNYWVASMANPVVICVSFVGFITGLPNPVGIWVSFRFF